MSRAGSGAAFASDEGQRALVSLPPDACGVVVGAPGTGKTATLVARVERLLSGGLLDARRDPRADADPADRHCTA